MQHTRSWWKNLGRPWIYLGLLVFMVACNQQAKPDTGDQNAPTVSLQQPVGGAAVGASVTIQGSATDDRAVTRVTYQLNGGEEQSVSITPAANAGFSFSAELKAGQNVIVVNAYDAAGNLGYRSLNVTYGTSGAGSSDTLPPDIRISSPPTSTVVNTSSVPVQGTVWDNVGVARIAYQVNGGPEQNVSFTGTTSVNYSTTVNGLVPGIRNSVVFNAYDTAGNKDSFSIGIIYKASSSDTVKPSLSVSSPASGSTVNSSSVNVQGQASDNVRVARLTYQLNGGGEQAVSITPGASVHFSFSVGSLQPGSNTLTLNAYDDSGNKASTSLSFSYSQSSPTPPPTGGQNLPTLLQAYYVTVPIPPQYGGLTQQTSIRYMKYYPRQFDTGLQMDLEDKNWAVSSPGPYKGYDALTIWNYGTWKSFSTDQFLFIRLSREAKVGVIWNATPLPGWLSGWQKGSDVKLGNNTASTYWKNFPAGDHRLGGMYNANGRMYQVLFAEADGTPSKAPSVPGGFEVPKPNAACPAWVHDQYTVQGFDGKTYPTWHPQVDPVYWCYFSHEHGSRPAQFPQVASLIQNGEMKIAFDYPIRTALATEKAACQNCHLQKLGREVKESRNFTFKLFALDRDGYLWISQAQMGSGDVSRLCVRHHQYDFWVVNKASGELVASLHYVADTGQARNNAFDEKPYRPVLCPEQADLNVTRFRRIPSYDSSGGLGPGGYETWQFEFPHTLGFVGHRVYATDNPQARCAYGKNADGTWSCNSTPPSPVPTDMGENRWFVSFGDDASGGASSQFGVDASRALAQGVFCTNPFGTELRDCGAPGAIRQYIKPGLRVTHSGVDRGRFIPYDMWDVQYRHGEGYDEYHNIEGGLGRPN